MSLSRQKKAFYFFLISGIILTVSGILVPVLAIVGASLLGISTAFAQEEPIPAPPRVTNSLSPIAEETLLQLTEAPAVPKIRFRRLVRIVIPLDDSKRTPDASPSIGG